MQSHHGRWSRLTLALVGWSLTVLTGCAALGPTATSTPVRPTSDIILATTTSTQDSGLLDVLVPAFEKEIGYRVKTIAVGTGQALALGERGEADVLLVHAPDSERKFLEAGHGKDRRFVMYNDFIIVGPPADPAGIAGLPATDALAKIAAKPAPFISRGDNSGTHQLEQKLWGRTTVKPDGQPWYQQAGAGMGATLNIAAEKGAYTITDRATFLSLKDTLGLKVLVEGDPLLLNIYSVIRVDPAKNARINASGAQAFSDFMVAAPTQALIKDFGVAKFGQSLFVPAAGKDETKLPG
ncbi:MAG: substrate-binding domain-containing protein [Chloroflexi bacterium]|nr:substrate-binding domain-containing protein [Chloroflexota bacterium]